MKSVKVTWMDGGTEVYSDITFAGAQQDGRVLRIEKKDAVIGIPLLHVRHWETNRDSITGPAGMKCEQCGEPIISSAPESGNWYHKVIRLDNDHSPVV